jgi:tryptophan-rich sensory protein
MIAIMNPAHALPIRSPLKLIASVIMTNLAGFIGSFFTTVGPGSWYNTLNKPWFTPPGWFTGLVWTILYILMGIAFYFIWMDMTEDRPVGLAPHLFFIQLALNVLWPYAFFGLQSLLLGQIVILVLWAFILATIGAFSRANRTAAALLIPYILWVTFALCLTYRILLLNP